MGNFAWIRQGNIWDVKSPLHSTEMQQLDAMRPKLANFAEGSVHAPTAPVIVGGEGMRITGKLEMNDIQQAVLSNGAFFTANPGSTIEIEAEGAGGSPAAAFPLPPPPPWPPPPPEPVPGQLHALKPSPSSRHVWTPSPPPHARAPHLLPRHASGLPLDAGVHGYFEGDDAKAAEAHRLERARFLIRSIRVVVQTEEAPIETKAFHVVTQDESRGYRPAEQVFASETLSAQVVGNALRELAPKSGVYSATLDCDRQAPLPFAVMNKGGLSLLVLAVAGCGGASMVGKQPVADRGASTGLRGCEELADGVVMDIGVQAPPGKHEAAAAQNAPEQVQAASATVPRGVPRYHVSGYIFNAYGDAQDGGPVAQAPAVHPSGYIFNAYGDAARPGAAPPDSDLRQPADTVLDRIEGGVAAPGSSQNRIPCGDGAGYCVKVVDGPFVVTDLHVAPGCPTDLIAMASAAEVSRWTIPTPAGAPLSIHGARLAVRQGEVLLVGAQASTAARLSADQRCAVVWSGFRPYTAP